MLKEDIHIRDPFILPDRGRYYMYGTRCGGRKGFDVYTADTLDGGWSGPAGVFDASAYGLDRGANWAPEVHLYRGCYYMFATFEQDNGFRGTYILRADKPDGPFTPHGAGAITPREWHSLDGTFYLSPGGIPYMVFCHEWVQIDKGTICAVRLSDDLRTAAGECFTVLEAKDAHWVRPSDEKLVTDGPWLHRKSDGSLVMIWSSFSGGYITAVAASDNGDITGRWTTLPGLLFEKDGGHGMMFEDFDGQLTLSLHAPNSGGNERPVFIKIREDNEKGFTAL
ncbi:MAG: glycoside hydrolase family 43 protein [Eubacteriales bacterium]|nr:glycoside hydrolase family 43 protein [Eubacteriales bacterium]